MFLRVISGMARGKKLSCPDGQDIRPTLDRVKESIFNMIAFDLPDACVLDLFSGSGALGIEALSRGAKSCVFLDKSAKSISATTENLKATRLDNSATVINSDSIDFLNNTDKKFDIIFIDPPYDSSLYEETLSKIKKNKLLTSDGLLVVEYDIEVTPTFNTCGFEIIKEKKYGRVKILIMKE